MLSILTNITAGDDALPVPGLSNVNSRRLGNKSPRVVPTGKEVGGGGLVVRPSSALDGSVKPGAHPVPYGRIANDPWAPTTTAPRSVFRRDPEAYHAMQFPLIPAVGYQTPFKGIMFGVGNRVGGVPLQPKPLLAGLELPLPRSRVTQGTSPADLRMAIAKVRRGQKRRYRLTPGIGGADLATSPRFVPDLPDGVREAIPPKMRRMWNGFSKQYRQAPMTTVRSLATARVVSRGVAVQVPVMDQASVSGSLPPAASQAVSSVFSRAVPPGAASETGTADGPSGSSMAPLGLIAVALIAALVVLR